MFVLTQYKHHLFDLQDLWKRTPTLFVAFIVSLSQHLLHKLNLISTVFLTTDCSVVAGSAEYMLLQHFDL